MGSPRETLAWRTVYSKLPKTLYAGMAQECRERGLSIAGFMKRAVEALLEDEAELDRLEKEFHRARSVLYSARSS